MDILIPQQAQTPVPQIQPTDIDRPTVVIRLTEFYRPELEHERFALYEATRTHWSLHDDSHLKETKIALSVRNEIVLEVYEIAAWVPANTTMLYFRMDKGEKERVEFVGDIAREPIRAKFRGKSIAAIVTKGNRHGVVCLGV